MNKKINSLVPNVHNRQRKDDWVSLQIKLLLDTGIVVIISFTLDIKGLIDT